MRKYQKAAVAVTLLGSIGLLGAGIGHAADGDQKAKADAPQQNQKCSADETNWGGLVVINDVNVVVNVLGIQVNDQSERKTVKCTQVAPARK
ncbi:hypothetical protein StrepF001_43245 [Streptomyces sp. F001]|uniref:hypothetical protein n=1 Tax=Streptomyces sp. F001 TaxID=1510026 RepID=UPI00101E6506|nr:hypothetical protein [Streptomyces sp. F001]RZB13606.1 hypothetical protein StrepF001_43245 [Streptomyces sp. F001]